MENKDQYNVVADSLDDMQKDQVKKSRELESACLSLIKEALDNLSDGRWCSIAITDIEKAFMSVRKAITLKSKNLSSRSQSKGFLGIKKFSKKSPIEVTGEKIDLLSGFILTLLEDLVKSIHL